MNRNVNFEMGNAEKKADGRNLSFNGCYYSLFLNVA